MHSTQANFISIYDNTASARYVYLSESVQEVLGYTPSDMIGTAAYEYFLQRDIPAIHRFHMANVMKEKMSTMLTYRVRHKDGYYVLIDTVVHYCYDVVVCSNFVHDPGHISYKMRCNSVDEAYIVQEDATLQLLGAWNDRQDVMKENLQSAHRWINERIAHNQEPRFCLIINRFTTDATIVFVSKMAETLVGVNCEEVVGSSLFDHVSERDVDVVQIQMDLSRTTDMVIRLRFEWVIDKEKDVIEPVEAILSSTNDGMILVVRLAPRLTI